MITNKIYKIIMSLWIKV